jgi:hypothetical protein
MNHLVMAPPKAGQNHNLLLANKPLETVAKSKYVGNTKCKGKGVPVL